MNFRLGKEVMNKDIVNYKDMSFKVLSQEIRNMNKKEGEENEKVYCNVF